MKLIPRLPACLMALIRHPAGAPPVAPMDEPDTAILGVDSDADDECPRGCGWFDSSHELHCGLSVREHASADTLAQELPLSNWLDLHLSGWQGLRQLQLQV